MKKEIIFEKIKKKYALNNSYFKNKRPENPQTPYEVFLYQEQHSELPYKMELEEGWIEECFAEYQKRNTSYKFYEQFFTPKQTSKRMAELADKYGDGVYVLDACCGYGALSTELKKTGFIVKGMDIDDELCKFYEENIGSEAQCLSFEDYLEKQKIIVANPPYSIKTLTAFLVWLNSILEDNGIAVLLLPKNFIDKERPKTAVEALNKFEVLHREDMTEEFSRTKIQAEIIVFENNN